MSMARTLVCCLVLACATMGAAAPAFALPHQEVTVLVKPAAIPAFDAIEHGMRDTVGARAAIRVLLATDFGGQPGGVVAAARAEHPVVIVVLGTPLSQAFHAALTEPGDPPIISAAISDPSKVLGSEIQPPRTTNITVVRDGPPQIYSDTAVLIGQLVPRIRRLGTVYNDHEDNSVYNRDRIREVAAARRWELVEKVITDPTQVESVGQSLLSEHVDAIWISKDRIMTSQPGPLIEAAHARGVPVFASDAGTVETFSAVATRSVSPYQIGQHVGAVVLEVLDGKAPSQMPVSAVSETTTFISAKAVGQLDLELPNEVLRNATVFGTDANPVGPAAASGQAGVMYVAIVGGVLAAIAVILILIRVLSRKTPPTAA